MDNGLRALTAVIGSILALSIISVVLSQRANTAGVINAGSSGLASLITAATAPITGSSSGVSSGIGSTSNLLNIFGSVLAG